MKAKNSSAKVKWIFNNLSVTRVILLTLVFCFFVAAKPWHDFEKKIPCEHELVRIGPLEAQSIRGRNAAVRFHSSELSSSDFLVASYAFNKGMDIFSVLDAQRSIGITQAYLWIYSEENEASIWRVDIGDVNVLSFETAKRMQKISSKVRRDDLIIAAVALILFLFTFVSSATLTRSARHHRR